MYEKSHQIEWQLGPKKRCTHYLSTGEGSAGIVNKLWILKLQLMESLKFMVPASPSVYIHIGIVRDSGAGLEVWRDRDVEKQPVLWREIWGVYWAGLYTSSICQIIPCYLFPCDCYPASLVRHKWSQTSFHVILQKSECGWWCCFVSGFMPNSLSYFKRITSRLEPQNIYHDHKRKSWLKNYITSHLFYTGEFGLWIWEHW